MSILSCERLEQGGFVIEVTEKNHSIHVDFSIGSIIPNTYNTTNSITIRGNAGLVQIGDGQGYQPANQNYIANANNGATFWNNTTMFQVVGYKFFFLNGFLKCIKKELGASNIYGNATVVASTQPAAVFTKGPFRNSLCEPFELVGTLTNRRMLVYIQAKLLALAERKKISVPKKFIAQSEPADNQTTLKPFFALFDWLAYPLFREIDSVALSHNLNAYSRKMMSPWLKPMNFKDLVEFYYGTSTGKMLEEIWKIITWGGEFRRFQFSAPVVQSGAMQEFLMRDEGTIEVGPDYAIGMGNRRLQLLAFTVGPALFKTAGFDYLYQFLPLLGSETGVYKRNPGRVDPADFPSSSYFQKVFSHLLNYITPKKLINMLSEEEIIYKMNLLEDTYDMLFAYSEPDKIPRPIRHLYPKGLEIDFKFKTLKEFHDKVSVQYTIVKTEADKKDIPAQGLYQKLDGKQKNGIELVVPRNTSDLSVWGKLLNICVASYGDKAARGDTLLLGVKKDGAIKYCIEFRTFYLPEMPPPEIGNLTDGSYNPPLIVPQPVTIGRQPPLTQIKENMAQVSSDYSDEAGLYYEPSIVQFYGYGNSHPPEEDRTVVMNLLIGWIMENLQEFKALMPGIIKRDFDANWHENFRLQDYMGQPDQLIVNQQAYNAYQNILNVPVVDPGPPPVQYDNDVGYEIQNYVVDDNI